MTAEADNPAPPPGMARYRRRRRVRTALGVAAALVVLGAATLAGLGIGGSDPASPAASNQPPGTAQVKRTTLVQTERVAGTLGYGTPVPLTARAGAAQPQAGPSGDAEQNPPAAQPTSTGTITWLPPVGTIVQPGDAVYKVDDQPVVLVAGTLPPYRVLADGVTGADVKQYEENLRAFGYRGFTVDTKYTAETATAVKRWQKKLGLEQTGTVDVSRIAVAAGEIRVTEHKAAVGAEAVGPVLAYTGTIRVVSVPLEVDRQHLVSVGLTATVTLPNGQEVDGTVASIGTVARAPSQEQGGPPGGGQQPATVDVVVTIADQAALGTLDAAPVSLTLVVAERRDVRAVPVGALVALAEGGYGVQVVEGTTTRYVAVKTGMFAGGLVEVSGAEIAEGTTVGVPA